MRTLLCSIFLLLVSMIWSVRAESLCYPIRGTKQLHSASFGELRENHFHSGVDIKTEGEEGRPVVAIADGYIVRVVVSPGGYGRALYVYHPQLKKMSVYAHLLAFVDVVEQRVFAEQCRRQSNRVTIFPNNTEFRVRRGDVIGWSGNSGSSFGAHLHFELRDASGERVYNVVRQGFMRPADNVRPQLLRLYRIEVDTIDGVAVEQIVRLYDICRHRGGYTIGKEVEIGKNGYFVIECRDRQNGTINRYGLYRTTMRVDGRKVFERCADSFTFAESRYCNLIGYYPLMSAANCEVLRLVRPNALPQHLFKTLVDDGRVVADVGQKRRVAIEVEDDCGNVSKIEFTACGANLGVKYKKRPTDYVVRAGENCTISGGNVTVTLNEKSLYDTAFCSIEPLNESVEIESVEVLSSPYRILSADEPLRGYMNIAWRCNVPPHLMRNVALARSNYRGEYRYAGGICWGGSMITLQSRTAGEYVVVADTVAPTIKPLKWSRNRLVGLREFRFEVKDNFSGIKRYECRINGCWAPIEYRPIERVLIYRPDKTSQQQQNGNKAVELRVEDGCGNITRWQGELP